MADRKLLGLPTPSCPPSSHQNGLTGSLVGLGHHSLVPSRTPASISLGAPLSGPGSDNSSSYRPLSQSLSSATSSGTRNKRQSSQQEEPEALLDLIPESQGKRLEDQKAKLSLLPDPGPATLCGACSSEQPSMDFYYMLIHYQSDRIEDQRCPLPDLDYDDMVPDGQENFFSLIQKV
ncbi:hypothetical protein PAMP_021662 [Pampus punctatissimus]